MNSQPPCPWLPVRHAPGVTPLTTALLCLLVFGANHFVWTASAILYHRGITHGALRLGPRMRWWLRQVGFWTTATDLTGWVVMHRRHHHYADVEGDPHSPHVHGVFGITWHTILSLRRTVIALRRGEDDYVRFARDLPPPHVLSRDVLFLAPFALHAGIALSIGVFASWWVALAWFLPYEPLLRAWLVHGEGYQNNHHFIEERGAA